MMEASSWSPFVAVLFWVVFVGAVLSALAATECGEWIRDLIDRWFRR